VLRPQRIPNSVQFQLSCPIQVFVSGIGFGGVGSESIQLEMLFEYLEGRCGSANEQGTAFRKQSRVFFLGNSFRTDAVGSERFKMAAENSKKLDQMLSVLSVSHDHPVSAKVEAD